MASPSDDELLAAVKQVRDAHPELGVLKLWAQLKNGHSEWAVSEKRFRKALAAAGGTGSGGGATAKSVKTESTIGNELVADTGLDPTLDVAAIAPKVKAKMFGGTRGKGLVAKAKLEEGEVIWQEEPWIACADPQLKQHLVGKRLCTHCLQAWPQATPPMSVECPKCSDAHFCNRLCQSRARPTASHHDLLCEGVNPAARTLNQLVAKNEWRSLDIVARILALWISRRAWAPEEADKISQRVWKGTARVNMRTREMDKADWAARGGFLERQWTAGRAAVLEALNPQGEAGKKKLTQILQKVAKGRNVTPLSEEEEKTWFGEEAFLELLGMVNINLEDSGGLYALHAHLNHSCEPNVQVRNLPKTFTPPTSLPAPLPGRTERGTHKLTLLARKIIHPGDELSISYVNLDMPREDRRQALRDGYGFWCVCPRCAREEKAEKKAKEKERKAKEAAKPDDKKRPEEGNKDTKEVAKTDSTGTSAPIAEATQSEGAATDSSKVESTPATSTDADDLAQELDELAVDDML